MYDMRNSAEGTGRSVDEAVRRALEALGISKEDAEITILDEGSRGVLGIGARDARVRAERRTVIDPGAMGGADVRDMAASTLRELLTLMGFAATVNVEETPGIVRLSIRGENLAGLIGRKGLNLKGLESLLNLMVGRKTTQAARIELDAGEYWQRRQTGLEELARRTAERVARRRREIALPPMDAHDRRIIHVALQGHSEVTTTSRGEGDLRRVVVVSRIHEHASRTEESRAASPPAKPAEGERPLRQAGSPNSRGRPARGESRSNTRASPSQPTRREGTDRSRFQGNARPPWRRTSQPAGGRLEPGAGALPRGRPEGLPSDEELEAEIEAHLQRISQRGTTGPAEPPTKESDDSED